MKLILCAIFMLLLAGLSQNEILQGVGVLFATAIAIWGLFRDD